MLRLERGDAQSGGLGEENPGAQLATELHEVAAEQVRGRRSLAVRARFDPADVERLAVEPRDGRQVTGNCWAARTDAGPFIDARYLAEAENATVTAWVANATTATMLANLKQETGSQRPSLEPDPTLPTRHTLGGAPLLVSRGVPNDTVYGVAEREVMPAIRQDVSIVSDRSRYLELDSVGVRATMRLAWVFLRPFAVQRIILAP